MRYKDYVTDPNQTKPVIESYEEYYSNLPEKWEVVGIYPYLKLLPLKMYTM